MIACKKENPPFNEFKKVLSPIAIEELYKKGNRTSLSDSINYYSKHLLEVSTDNNDAYIKGKTLEAKYLWRTGQHQKAITSAMEGLKEAHLNNNTKQIPWLHAILANVFKEKESYSLAMENAKKGLDQAITSKDTVNIIYLMRVNAMIWRGYGMVTNNENYINKSITTHLEGLKLAESSPKYKLERPGYYSNISQFYLEHRNDFESAIYYGLKGHEISTKNNDFSNLSYISSWLGIAYYKKGDNKRGEHYLNEALIASQKTKRIFREMEIYREFSEYNALNGNYKASLDYLKRYNSIHDSLGVVDNLKAINELEVQYKSELKDKQIALLNQIEKNNTAKFTLAIVVLSIVVISIIILSFQYRQIRNNNKKIVQQADKLQLLLKELHHRVKNNLQIISSLLSLQSNRLVDEDVKKVVQTGQQRIEAMSLIHRNLYQLNNPGMVNMKEYITDLCESLSKSFGFSLDDLQLKIEIDLDELDVDKAIPLGLIINEWITNAFKYAYEDVKRPELTISLTLEEGIKLSIEDNGPGLPTEKWENPQSSFGLKLVKVLSKQLNGHFKLDNTKGTLFSLNIPMAS
ncbi:signal transduction histidine kinase [Solitalea canadensis DSM 3403]|uniref:histidine kinase n=2 Tax=Solitalea canadensis TaxID=995 RepID=H8KSE2_SOLCM|nr:signal transduction histidine kinase [Solitalea canadensis DSM 3403]